MAYQLGKGLYYHLSVHGHHFSHIDTYARIRGATLFMEDMSKMELGFSNYATPMTFVDQEVNNAYAVISEWERQVKRVFFGR